MTKPILIKLDDGVFEKLEQILSKSSKRNRNRYINEAIRFYNAYLDHQFLVKEFEKAAKLSRKESMDILAEFEALDDNEID